MRREQERWKRAEWIQGEEKQIAKETSKIPAGHIRHTTAVAILSLCTGRTPSDLAIQSPLWIAGVCFSVEQRERAVCCPGKAETEKAILL
jgi:hypothetical protein